MRTRTSLRTIPPTVFYSESFVHYSKGKNVWLLKSFLTNSTDCSIPAPCDVVINPCPSIADKMTCSEGAGRTSDVLASVSDTWRQCLKTLVEGGQVDDADSLRHDLLVAVAYVALGAPSLWRHPTGGNSQVKVDEARRRWGLPGGDLSAVMQSFRAWSMVAKRERPLWCQKNCVNPEAMSAIEDKLLKVKAEENIVSTRFLSCNGTTSNNAYVNDAVSRILLPMFFERLCVHVRYSDRGAYVNISSGKPHRLYPESCLLLSGSLPEFVLDLPGAKGPAREYLVQLPLSCTKHVIYDYMKDNPNYERTFSLFEDKLPVVFSMAGVGSRVINVLAKSTNDVLQLRKQTARASRVARELIGILPDRHNKCLKICCPQNKRAEVEKYLGEKIASIKSKLESQVERIPYPKPESGLKILLGPGAKVTELDTTHSRDTILIYVTAPRDTRMELHDKLTQACVRRHFERRIGNIVDIGKSSGFPNNPFWGKMKFERLMDSFKAVSDINADGGIYHLVPAADPKKPLFNLRFTMKRRSIDKRKICVKLANKTDFIRSRYNRWYNEAWYMSAEFLPEQLMIIFTFNGTLKTLGQIAQTFMRRLHVNPMRVDYWQQPPYISTPAELKKTRDRIIDVFSGDIEDYRRRLEPDVGPVDVVLETPRPTDMVQRGQVITSSATIAGFLYQSGYITFYIGRRELNFDDKPFVTFIADSDLVAVIKPEINDLVESLSSAEVKVKFKSLVNGKDCIEVYCSYPDVLKEACKEVDVLIEGKTLTDLRMGTLQALRKQTDTLKNLMTETVSKIDIAADYKNVKLYGSIETIAKAEKMLREYIEKQTLDQECWIPLAEDLSPRGLLQYMVNRYGENLHGLQQKYPGKLTLDHTKHAIHYAGPPQEQDRLQTEVEKCITALQENEELPSLQNPNQSNPESPTESVPDPQPGTSETVVPEAADDFECAACLCPADDCLTMSTCGHVYCKGCFQMQLTTAVKARELPIVCAKERCGDLICLDDIRHFCDKDQSITFPDIHSASVETFLRRCHKRARPCPTPNCQMIYDVTEDAVEFSCPLCDCSICSRCHLKYHHGLSCEVVKVMEGINDKVKQWINEKPQSRKVCPSCHAGVEKWIGCDNVRCVGCGVYMCWRCLKYFDSEAECYVHMDKKHRF